MHAIDRTRGWWICAASVVLFVVLAICARPFFSIGSAVRERQSLVEEVTRGEGEVFVSDQSAPLIRRLWGDKLFVTIVVKRDNDRDSSFMKKIAVSFPEADIRLSELPATPHELRMQSIPPSARMTTVTPEVPNDSYKRLTNNWFSQMAWTRHDICATSWTDPYFKEDCHGGRMYAGRVLRSCGVVSATGIGAWAEGWAASGWASHCAESNLVRPGDGLSLEGCSPRK